MKVKFSPDILHTLSTQKYLQYIRSYSQLHADKVKTYGTVILTLLAFIIFGVFAIGPTISTITELKKTLDDNKYIDLQLQNKINNLTQLRTSYSSLSPQLPQLYAAIPQTPDVTNLSGKIRSIAAQYPISLSQLQVQNLSLASEDTTSQELQSVSLVIAVQGDIANIKKFYEALILFDRIISIQSMTLLLPSESESSTYRLVIRASAYFQGGL